MPVPVITRSARALSGTGHEITITDDYWYSDDLKVYLVLKHNDPRTGEQIVGIGQHYGVIARNSSRTRSSSASRAG